MGRNNNPKHVNKVMNESIAEPTQVPSPEEAIAALKIDMQMAFIDADAFVADPYALLGQVIQIRKKNGKCPTTLSEGGFPVELTPYPIPRKVNEASKLASPALRKSILVDSKLAASVSFLSYLSAELNANTSFSLIVFDQAAGLIDTQDKDWRSGLENWKKENKDLIEDDEICYLFAVAGFIQKNIVRKKYERYTGQAKGGAFGVNINGELSTGTEDYSLDIKFGLTPIVIKRPAAGVDGKKLGMTAGMAPSVKPSRAELQLFMSTTGAILKNNQLKVKRKKAISLAE